MYGNFLGWIISALIVAATVAGISFLDRRSRPTPPDAFGLDPQNAAPLELPPATLVLPQRQPGDAAAQYRALIDQAIARGDELAAFAQRGTISELPKLESLLEALSAAAKIESAAIFRPRPAELINYDNDKPAMIALERLGKAAIRAALLTRSTDPEFAARTLRAVFALGYHQFAERLTYEQLDLGLRLMAESAAGLKQMAKDSGDVGREKDITQFDADRLMLVKTRILPIASRIRTMDGRVVAANAGNMIRWARDPGIDRVWRVESILALGRMRYSVGTGGTLGDQKQAARTLQMLQNDPDPLAQLAARRALELTVEQYRLLR